MKKIHHANVLIGGENYSSLVFEILKKDLNFNPKANPDFLFIECQSFGINDARNLEKWALGRPLLGEVKVSLVATKSITYEAQNVLLKVLEEPPLGTYIFINLDNLGGLLATFVSRVRILNVPQISIEKNIHDSDKDTLQDQSNKFFYSTIDKRLSIIQSLSNHESKSDMKELIKNLEEVSYRDYTKEATVDITKAKIIKNILTAKIFASARGSSPKMLMEWLSCVL